ncbi:hypothetical protein M441DRAFT_59168 [Trichoderma asperellum CBS 433.97]|uniref:Uncharacterized protein n=1 Tax=Trichoderma asperellum (strain ATCC 204424 / CBS 433.97 / NBRC 101777) TaxID=1042311 RepID=A0A2T3Z6J8_TRIA4|nr:hypothetical protein M441DRAFT_59168 [Trichoderma asperellum CBS 433.97]PTB40422.1 hypothetical protein M441DRAFT_59168 [Trichoderma asperellum CBS 433.97]
MEAHESLSSSFCFYNLFSCFATVSRVLLFYYSLQRDSLVFPQVFRILSTAAEAASAVSSTRC